MVIDANDTATTSWEDFFDSLPHIFAVVIAGFVSLCILCVVIIVCIHKKKNSKLTYAVSVRRISRVSCKLTNPESPIYCEVDMFQYPSSEVTEETHEDAPETESDRQTDSENSAEDDYSYPQYNYDVYETMGPPQAGGIYSCAYDHVNIKTINSVNSEYVNMRSPCDFIDDLEYEYPQNRRNSADHSYHYAYDHRHEFSQGFRDPSVSSSAPELVYTPPDKDEFDCDVFANDEVLSRESLESDNETIHLEYVKVL